MYTAYVVKIEHLDKHPNADRLQIATIFGEETIVSLDIKLGDIGIYFPAGGQLSEEFCDQNHMCRKHADGTPDTGYLEREKRNVSAIRLRGVKSNGVYCPISSVAYTGVDLNSLTPGFMVTTLNGHEICQKYIPRTNHRSHGGSQGGTKKVKTNIAPLFREHDETEQLAYNLGAFKSGDQIEITLKMHGTSQRTGYLPVLKGYKRTFWDRIFRRQGTPIYDWGYVTGTRRTVLENYDGGFYGSDQFRAPHAKAFEGKLWKGETVYYEVVGFTDSGTPIMPSAPNKKLNDKDFVKMYGDTTVFSYGCHPEGEKLVYGIDEHGAFAIPVQMPKSDFYVYRMTMTNEDGNVVEYTPDFMRYRCEQMGVKTVPLMAKGVIDDEGVYVYGPNSNYGYPYETDCVGDTVKEIAEKYYDGPDPVGKTHVREGVVVRIVNRSKFTAFKHKNFSFKVLSGIAIDQAETSGDLDSASDDILAEM